MAVANFPSEGVNVPGTLPHSGNKPVELCTVGTKQPYDTVLYTNNFGMRSLTLESTNSGTLHVSNLRIADGDKHSPATLSISVYRERQLGYSDRDLENRINTVKSDIESALGKNFVLKPTSRNSDIAFTVSHKPDTPDAKTPVAGGEVMVALQKAGFIHKELAFAALQHVPEYQEQLNVAYDQAVALIAREKGVSVDVIHAAIEAAVARGRDGGDRDFASRVKAGGGLPGRP